ncbi:MAG TPA: FAA hydrolase family protein, partial [Verrucomicrobia bacterium]|nr:FAA hydrolase family protein [Verrucomicrobiota bacterium]
MSAAAAAAGESIPDTDDLLTLLPHGTARAAALRVEDWMQANPDAAAGLGVSDAKILTPIPRPNKLLLLAGNYAKHIEESGGIAVERARTFPYVFMKPPSTTLNRHGGGI